MSGRTATVVQPEEGKRLRIFGGIEFVVKVSSQESTGAFTLLENLIPPGTYLPPHVHAREDETFSILEGDFEFQLGERTVRAGPGATVYAPSGTPHALRLVGSTPGRILLLATPGGFERCMEELDALPDPPDMLVAFQICGRHGIEFLPQEEA